MSAAGWLGAGVKSRRVCAGGKSFAAPSPDLYLHSLPQLDFYLFFFIKRKSPILAALSIEAKSLRDTNDLLKENGAVFTLQHDRHGLSVFVCLLHPSPAERNNVLLFRLHYDSSL